MGAARCSQTSGYLLLTLPRRPFWAILEAPKRGDGARCQGRSFDSRGPGQIPGALLF
jgi:hypothetical protein